MSPMVQLARRDVRLKHHNRCQGPMARNIQPFRGLRRTRYSDEWPLCAKRSSARPPHDAAPCRASFSPSAG
jgi:hypothetical protein